MFNVAVTRRARYFIIGFGTVNFTIDSDFRPVPAIKANNAIHLVSQPNLIASETNSIV